MTLKSQKRWGVLAGVLFLAALLGVGIAGHLRQRRAQSEFAAKTSAVTVEFVRVHRREKPIELTLPGNIEAVHQTTLNARVTGYVARWLVDIGDTVKEGQFLAEIATPDLDEELAQARHELQEAQANYQIARVTGQREAELQRQQVISKEENDTAQSAFQAAAATVLADQSNVNRLLALEGFKQVTAPFAGRITARQIDVGSLVNVGSGSTGTPLYTVAQTNPLNIFVNVPQSDAPSIHDGLKVRLLVEEYPTRNFEATVVRTADALDPASRTLNTEMQIANDDGALFAGMYAQLEFTLLDAGSPIVIPASAFVFGADGSKVATLTKDGRIHWQKIAVGRDFGTEMEVLSGLQDNDAVILNPVDDLTEGLTVVAKPAIASK
jgi:RND family efflux transporter MFP subunit